MKDLSQDLKLASLNLINKSPTINRKAFATGSLLLFKTASPVGKYMEALVYFRI
jgi:hypothetical protein